MDQDNMSKMSSEKVARPYQVELLQQAVQKNSIVYLGTGAGKTFIATMLIKELSAGIFHEGKKTVFLVHRLPLATQQEKFIKDNTSLTVRSFCGADNVDFWKPDEWKREIDKHQVLVMIHDVFKIALHHGYFHMEQANLIIVDECHHSFGNSSFNQIFMQHYHPLRDAFPDRTPRILGLSASLVTSKVKSIDEFHKMRRELEFILDSTVITTEDLADLLKFATQPDEFQISYQSSPIITYVTEMINEGQYRLESVLEDKIRNIHSDFLGVPGKQAIENAKSSHKKFKRIVAQLDKAITELGLFHGKELLKLSEEYIEMELLTKAEDPYKARLSQEVRKTIRNLRSQVDVQVDESLSSRGNLYENYTTNKVKTLVKILQNFDLKDEDGNDIPMRVLVFVQERMIAVALASLLAEVADLKGISDKLRVSYAVGGQNTNKFKEPSSQKLQDLAEQERIKLEQTIQKFKTGRINCLVSTDVLEEGIDVTQCNLVIRFDPILTFRSYLQSKGRARAKPSKYIIMIESSKVGKMTEELNNFKRIEKTQIDQYHDEFEEDETGKEDVEDPYFSDPNDQLHSPRITGLTAVSILHQYIQTLPVDRFTKLAPFFEYEEVENNNQTMLFAGLGFEGHGNVKAVLHMPHLTPYREPLVSDARKNKTQAKRAAALDACRKLHQDGLLNESLLPRKRVLDIMLDEFEDDSKRPKIGTKRSKSYYEIVLPTVMTSIEEERMILYKIELRLVSESSHTKNVKQYNIYDPSQFPRKLGIIVGGQDEIFEHPFDIFTLSGQVSVKLKPLGPFPSSKYPMKLLEDFHCFALAEVIGFNPNLVKGEKKSNEYLMVPLIGNEVDIEFLDSWNSANNATEKSEKWKFSEDDYKDAVVIPQHRKMENFFVEEIVREKCPLSVLPNHATQTYHDHYEKNFRCKISDLNQPLLRISNADKKHFMYAQVSTTQDFDERTELNRNSFLDKRTLLVPELTKVHFIPGSLWREIQMLPFVMNRLSSMSKVNHLMKELNKTVGRHYDLEDEKTFPQLIEDKPSFKLLIGKGQGTKLTLPDMIQAFTLRGAGETFDMEKAEILGDAFLKFAMSIALFSNKSISKGDEGYLTQYRSSLVGNKRLFKLAIQKHLHQFISACKFEPHLNWKPPRFGHDLDLENTLMEWDEEFRLNIKETKEEGEDTSKSHSKVTLFRMMTEEDKLNFQMKGLPTKKEFLKMMRTRLENSVIPDGDKVRPLSHVLMADKSIADVVEALIGVHLSKGGPEAAAKILGYLGLSFLPNDDIKSVIDYNHLHETNHKSWFKSNLDALPKTSLWLLEETEDSAFGLNLNVKDIEDNLEMFLRKVNVVQIESQIGYVFKEKSFLLQALTHSSYSMNKITYSYERLEFLGDAVLDYLVTCHLMSSNKDLTPGSITNLRSALVNNNTLADIAVENGLHKHLLQQSPELFKRISVYVDEHEVLQAEDMAKMFYEKNNELFNESDCPCLEQVEIPKALGDIVESLIGAIYLDTKHDLAQVWSVLEQLFGDRLSDVMHKMPKNFIVRLMEAFPERIKFNSPEMMKDGKVSIIVRVYKTEDDPMRFKGIGLNKKAAKVAAAKCAIRELKKRGIISNQV